MRVAFLAPDNRDELRRYGDVEPCFHPAPMASLEDLATIPEGEVHIVCCIEIPRAFAVAADRDRLLPFGDWPKLGVR
jgi:hypothetical protein